MKQSSLLSFFSKSPKGINGSGSSSPAASNGNGALAREVNTPQWSTPTNGNNSTSKGKLSNMRSAGGTQKRVQLDYGTSSDEDVKPVIKKLKVATSKRSNSSSKDKSNSASKKGKRVYSRIHSDDDDDEYVPKGKESSSSCDDCSLNEVEEDEDSPPAKAKASNGKKCNAKGKATILSTPTGSNIPSPALNTKSNTRISSTPSTIGTSSSTGNENWTHLSLEWVKPEKLRDSKMRKSDDDNYDPTTLHVPKEFLKSCSPGMRQWWLFKKEHFDTVLFFKVGKFYELYHMDAIIANQELGLIFMRGAYAHNGFPEPSYTYHANTLVDKGYKVARIEQIETPAMMQKRSKKAKVVNRAICEISTKGVRLPSFQNAESTGDSHLASDAAYFYSILEISDSDAYQYGVCFVDTTVGTFTLAQFTDGVTRSRLNTMFSKYPPAQIVYCNSPEDSFMSSGTLKQIKSVYDIRIEPMLSDKFKSAKETIKFLITQGVFLDEKTEKIILPRVFDNLCYLEEDGNIIAINTKDWGMAWKCLGGTIGYLTDCRAHIDLLSMGRFELYYPVEELRDIPTNENTVQTTGKFLTLDSGTLKTLEIVEGPNNLLSVLDRCRTPFGKRLLRRWVCQPLADAESISRRLDAVEDLMNIEEMTEKLSATLSSVPDLERLINKMHILGSEHRSKLHPDGQAQLFEGLKYSKNRILDFINLLKGMKKCQSAVTKISDFQKEIKSDLLLRLLTDFPNLNPFFEYFDGAFNPEAALKEGRIIPLKGSCLEYDASLEEIDTVQRESEVYLKSLCKEFSCRVEYFGNEKKRFQIQLPDSKKVSSRFTMSSSKKGFKRYTTAESEGFLKRTLEAEASRDAILGDVTRRMFWQFDKSRELWIKAIETISVLDVLMSLAKYSKSLENMCRPEVVESDKPYLKIVQGRHPSFLSETYIPNDCIMSSLKGSNAIGNFIMLTGANMGGKSTLMRQVGLLTILSHIGCYVPADICQLSTVDRVFTRIGANDNICGGESTFQVEVSETASVLRYGTKKSLVLIDELGRGTATYDGMSIAQSVATYLAENNMRTIFATHYHTLAYSMNSAKHVQQKHMAFEVKMVKDGDVDVEKLTFLYVMVDGHCDKSYGFHAARISGVPDEIVNQGRLMGDNFEGNLNETNAFRMIAKKMLLLKLDKKENNGPML